MTFFSCPICRALLVPAERTWRCENGHSYDVARSGYVNLLPPSGRDRHGDDRPMIAARRDFLQKGYYNHLADAVCREALRYAHDGCVVLDAGCGEGYYTGRLERTLREKAGDCRVFGVDLSKNALALAARTYPNVRFAAASVNAIPLLDNSVDIVVDIFSPLADREYHRVLKPDGVLLYAIPLEQHLFSLKQAVYREPYPNRVQHREIAGFAAPERTDIRRRITLPSTEDILSLFTMTPYFHKTSPEDMKKLSTLSSLETDADFALLCYRKL